MESVVEEKQTADLGAFARAWNEARPRVEAYLRAWRLEENARDQVLCETMRCFQKRLEAEPDLEPIRAAIEEADKLLQDNLNLFLAEVRRALAPQRKPETYRTTMQSSLSHLPSFRMIAGWFALIGGLLAAFLLTHH